MKAVKIDPSSGHSIPATVEAAFEPSTWCNDCGAPLEEGQECRGYELLGYRRNALLGVLRITKLTLKAKGPNVIVVDADGHEMNL